MPVVLQPNQIFADRYRVVRHIADGGMGAVYEAEHVSTEAHVALKLLLPHVVQIESARRRFELEAKVAARVKSDHIVKVFDAGLDAETRSPYLAMELLIGHTLAAQVKRLGPLGPDVALDVMRQVAHGLDAAHGYRAPSGTWQPIIHRDLKPENLFIGTRSDETPLVKILDFGIAKVLSESTEVSQEMRGTPLYMAFEQAAGEAVSPQTDVWALGLITFFALTGRHYWPAANKPNGSTPALFAEILTLPLPLPSERARQYGSLVLPRAFDAWMLTCIARTPSRRFASAGQAVDALEQALRGLGHRRAASGLGEGHLRSRVTAGYELLPTPTAGAARSSASVTGVASEHRSAPRHARGKPILLLALGATSACAIALGLAWRWFDAGRVGQQQSAAASSEPREVHSTPPAPAEQLRLPQLPTPEPSGTEASGWFDTRREAREGGSEEVHPRTPRVSVERAALLPAPAASMGAAAKRPPSAPPAQTATLPSERAPAAAPPRVAPTAAAAANPPKPSDDAPCELFDPYAGRCMSPTPGSARSP